MEGLGSFFFGFLSEGLLVAGLAESLEPDAVFSEDLENIALKHERALRQQEHK